MDEFKRFHQEEALRTIKANLSKGNIIWTSHIKEQMEARNISMQDILHALKTSKISEPPRLKEETNQFNYRVVGNSVDGDQLTVVVVLEEGNNLLVTTF